MAITQKGMTFERLDEHRRRALKKDLDLNSGRFIFLSDAHKWDRSDVDFFNPVESVYLGALKSYNNDGYTLVLLGDIEEGAGDMLPHVVHNYPDTFAKEVGFFPGRYVRIYGNHDHDWKKDDIRKLLDGVMGSPVSVWPAMVLGDRIMVVHGHEGDLFSDELHSFTQVILRGFKKLAEKLFGGKPSAAENSRVRNLRAKLLYKWAKRNGMIVVAGHTHLAYFESMSLTRLTYKGISHLEKTLKAAPPTALDGELRNDLARKKHFMMAHDRFWKKNESLPEGALPLYFNAGCCKYEDGLTAIEIAEGKISLVKWTKVEGSAPERTVLASRRLADLWARAKF